MSNLDTLSDGRSADAAPQGNAAAMRLCDELIQAAYNADICSPGDLACRVRRIKEAINAPANEPAPGNAAALRAALVRVKEARGRDIEYVTLADIDAEVDAALSATPRNCDLYRTLDEATSAWIECDDVDECGDPVEFDDWLFAPAEGGAE